MHIQIHTCTYMQYRLIYINLFTIHTHTYHYVLIPTRFANWGFEYIHGCICTYCTYEYVFLVEILASYIQNTCQYVQIHSKNQYVHAKTIGSSWFACWYIFARIRTYVETYTNSYFEEFTIEDFSHAMAIQKLMNQNRRLRFARLNVMAFVGA